MITPVIALNERKCVPCEGGIAPLAREQCNTLLDQLPCWTIDESAKRIGRKWVAQDFMAAIRFFDAVASLAEEEGHHPDLHLTGYRMMSVELTTHAIGGLSENDFIMAAKIDMIPIKEKRKNPCQS